MRTMELHAPPAAHLAEFRRLKGAARERYHRLIFALAHSMLCRYGEDDALDIAVRHLEDAERASDRAHAAGDDDAFDEHNAAFWVWEWTCAALLAMTEHEGRA